MQQCSGNREALFHAARISSDRFPAISLHSNLRQCGFEGGGIIRHLVEPGVKAQVLDASEVFIQERLVHNQADAMPGIGFGVINLAAVQPDRASFGFEQPGKYLQQGGFSSAVPTKQAEQLTRLHLQLKRVQNAVLTK